MPFGSGLNSLSKYRYDEGDFERVTWNDCNLNSGDCLTPKGFTFMRVRLAESTYIDFYNLHADAGSDGGDLSARAANFAQLSSFVQSHSAGNAVVVSRPATMFSPRIPRPAKAVHTLLQRCLLIGTRCRIWSSKMVHVLEPRRITRSGTLPSGGGSRLIISIQVTHF
jgi:hypothetical protein